MINTRVALFPDGSIYDLDEIPKYMGDDFEIRDQGFCTYCDRTIVALEKARLEFDVLNDIKEKANDN